MAGRTRRKDTSASSATASSSASPTSSAQRYSDVKTVCYCYGLPFMVCYVFVCETCSNNKGESWTPKQANFIHMLVTVLANLTADRLKAGDETKNIEEPLKEHMFFSIEKSIIPYFEQNWENLTSMPRRVKTTWHQTLASTLAKQGDLFIVNHDDATCFALAELDLGKIGPAHEQVKAIGKKTPSSNNLSSTLISAQATEKEEPADAGPKTRARRRTTDNSGQVKKNKNGNETIIVAMPGRVSPVEFPFNKESYRYFLVEKDPTVPNLEVFDLEVESSSAIKIHSFLYRVVHPSKVMISPNDRAHQLKVTEDATVVTGELGYAVARATHGAGLGTWYYEVTYLKQPEPDSAIRIGWATVFAVLQANVGYTKFSYSIRSKKGTKFHAANGYKYHFGGFQPGDVIGCLIHLPGNPKYLQDSTKYLPPSYKESPMINFKSTYFFEEQDDVKKEMKQLEIEFFHNGKSCGVAYEDIYAGYYFPAVSAFEHASLKCNFGPKFAFPLPADAKPMSARADEIHADQALSDMLYLVTNDTERLAAMDQIHKLRLKAAIRTK